MGKNSTKITFKLNKTRTQSGVASIAITIRHDNLTIDEKTTPNELAKIDITNYMINSLKLVGLMKRKIEAMDVYQFLASGEQYLTNSTNSINIGDKVILFTDFIKEFLIVSESEHSPAACPIYTVGMSDVLSRHILLFHTATSEEYINRLDFNKKISNKLQWEIRKSNSSLVKDKVPFLSSWMNDNFVNGGKFSSSKGTNNLFVKLDDAIKLLKEHWTSKKMSEFQDNIIRLMEISNLNDTIAESYNKDMIVAKFARVLDPNLRDLNFEDHEKSRLGFSEEDSKFLSEISYTIKTPSIGFLYGDYMNTFSYTYIDNSDRIANMDHDVIVDGREKIKVFFRRMSHAYAKLAEKVDEL